jgi:hypothetical protein
VRNTDPIPAGARYMTRDQACVRYGVALPVIDEIIRMADSPDILRIGKRLIRLPIEAYDKFMTEFFGAKE